MIQIIIMIILLSIFCYLNNFGNSKYCDMLRLNVA